MKGEGAFGGAGTLGPGSSLFWCLYRALTAEAELFWEALVGWERTGLSMPALAGSYCRAETGSGESLEARFLRETQGWGPGCVSPVRLGS